MSCGLNNGCDDVNLPASASGACVRSGEAQTGSHGGNDNSDNSGSLTYVTVDYAGDAFDTQTDLNGIGFQSVGSATTVNHIQVNNNVDDGVEFYGGAVDVSNIVLTENGDDSFDCTEGWAGSADKVLIIQSGNSDTHDRAFECDNNKSPGLDGLPYELYKAIWEIIGQDFVKVINCFKIKQFPQTIAKGYIHKGIMAGKLNGVIPAQTPKGCLIEYESTLVPTLAE